MSLTEIVIQGTLNPDGTLQLDEKPTLSPGRVTIVLRPAAEPTQAQEGWWPFMQAARKRMEEAGCHFMDEKEMQEHIEWLREGDRFDELLREADEQHQNTEEP